jgi:hypothetical protein
LGLQELLELSFFISRHYGHYKSTCNSGVVRIGAKGPN